MHAPDGFLDASTAVATGVLSLGAVTVALRASRARLGEKQIPLAGVTAAFVFAAQMVNFPVVAGTTGHLIGGALAAVLLGPSVGLVVTAIVVAVQALVFADGGVTALGYNVLNMAVVTSLGGYAVFRLARKVAPATSGGVTTAAAVAGALSVPLSAMALSIEWLFGATAPVPFDTVFGATVGIHVLIGIGEGLITATVVRSILAARPDLVHGADGIDSRALRAAPSASPRAVMLGGLALAGMLAGAVSQLAASGPDGLEAAAAEVGIAPDATHAFAAGPFADYATAGIDNESLSLAAAGVSGAVLVLAVGVGLLAAVRDGSRPPVGRAG